MALEGRSAAGKTTLARTLAARTGWVWMPEAFDRLRPRPSLTYTTPKELAGIERRLLAEERKRDREVRRLLEDGHDVLLDTGPLGTATYALGVSRLDPAYRSVGPAVARAVVADLRSQRLTLPERVVYLDVPDRILRRRARRSSAAHPARLSERHRKVGRIERGFWAELARRCPGTVCFVRATGPRSKLLGRVARRLSGPRPPLRIGSVETGLQSLQTRRSRASASQSD